MSNEDIVKLVGMIDMPVAVLMKAGEVRTGHLVDVCFFSVGAPLVTVRSPGETDSFDDWVSITEFDTGDVVKRSGIKS